MKKISKVILLMVMIVAITNVVSADWVFLGDSYFRRGRDYKTSIPDYIATMLDIKNYENLSVLGYGVANKGEQFIQELKGGKNRKVTDVMIHGGVMNDYRAGCTLPEISSAFESLIAKVKTKYPNARIWYVSMAYNVKNPALVKTHNARYTWYKDLAEKNGVIVLKNVRQILSDIPAEYFESDGFHPRKQARKIVAEMLVKKISKLIRG